MGLLETACVVVLLCGCGSWDVEDGIDAFAASCYVVVLDIGHMGRVLGETICMQSSRPCLAGGWGRDPPARVFGPCAPFARRRACEGVCPVYAASWRWRRGGWMACPAASGLWWGREGVLQLTNVVSLVQGRSSWRKLVVACSAANQ